MPIAALSNLKGGVGKSPLAVNLAEARSVHMIDADTQATTAEWMAGGLLPIKGEALPLDDEPKAAA